VIKVNNSTYKKFYIEALAAQEYSFVFANLDGSDESIGTIDKKDFVDLNFGYYSFETISSIDREPVANEWHLTFGKYEILIPTGPGTFLPYPVVGVRQNRGVRVAKLTGVDPETVKYPEWDELNYFLKITTIGSDWKTFNNTTFEYTIPKDLVYFISYDSLANLQAKIFRLYFTGYEGTGTGKIAFQKEQLQTSVIEQDGFKIADFAIYPNLISSGESFNLAIDSKINQVATIDIMSVDGTVLLSQQFSLDPTLNSLNLLPKGLASGMYFVKININGNCGIEKLIVQ